MIRDNDHIPHTITESFAQMKENWVAVLGAACVFGLLASFVPPAGSENAGAVLAAVANWAIVFLSMTYVAFVVHQSILHGQYGLPAGNGCSIKGFYIRVCLIGLPFLFLNVIFAWQGISETNPQGMFVYAAVGSVFAIVYIWCGTWIPASVVDQNAGIRAAFVRGRKTWLRALLSMIWVVVFAVLIFAPIVIAVTLVAWAGASVGDVSYKALSQPGTPAAILLQIGAGVLFAFFTITDAVIFCRAYLTSERSTR